MRWKALSVFLVGCVVGIALSYTAQSLLDAYLASTIKRSIGNARGISIALERYRQDNGSYPQLSENQLSTALTPKYLKGMPRDVYNGRPYVVVMIGAVPAVIAPGRGGFIVQKGEVTFFQPYRHGDEEQTKSRR